MLTCCHHFCSGDQLLWISLVIGPLQV